MFRVYFNDLKPEAQKALVAFLGITDPEEMNWDVDILPIVVIPKADSEQ
jgi:hypothetical protein